MIVITFYPTPHLSYHKIIENNNNNYYYTNWYLFLFVNNQDKFLSAASFGSSINCCSRILQEIEKSGPPNWYRT